MKEVFIGEYIRQRRLDLKLTQEQLCDGICEPATISRLENGRQTPSRGCVNALLERLGLPADRYFALLNENEKQISDLQAEIVACNVWVDSVQGLKKLAELEAITKPEDNITWQFILRSRAALGKTVNGEVVPYTIEEKLALLMQAIHLTVPRFSLDRISQFLYSFNEVKTINQIALAYSGNDQHDTTLAIYAQLLEYVRVHFANVAQSAGILPLVAYNYARELDIVGSWQAALEIAELGRKAAVQYGQYNGLPALLAVMAECYHLLGCDEQSIHFYYDAYYLARVTENTSDLDTVVSELKKYHNIVISA